MAVKLKVRMSIELRKPMLFVDDDEIRAKKMRCLMVGDESDYIADIDFEWVSTYDFACRRFEEKHWEMIMLDHDLEDPKDRDGQDLARKIVELQAEFGCFSRTSFIVHSSNTVGARRMHGILDRPDLNLVAPVVVPFTLFVLGAIYANATL